MKINGFHLTRKVMSFATLLVFCLQLIEPAISINSVSAAGTISFINDVEVSPVQTEEVIISGSGTNITSAKWVFGSDCSVVDFSTGTNFDLLSVTEVTTTIQINDESQNNNYVCVEIVDDGNTEYVQSQNVIQVDRTAPIVQLIGNNPETILVGSNYTESGAIWSDNLDGSGTIQTASSGSIDVNTTGSYILEYSYADRSGNTGSTERTVDVIEGSGGDQVPPTASVSYDVLSATSGSVVASLSGMSEAITVTNNSGSSSYTFTDNGSFTFEFVDIAGNTGSAVANVTWIDRVAPTVTLSGSSIINLIKDSTYIEYGAIWSDAVAGSGIILMPSSGSVDVTRTGSYILTYEKYDPAGNRGITTRTINIVDILDTTTPTATLLYTPNTLTNGNVLVILVSPSEPITLTNNSGSLSYIFSTNGSFSFTYQDASGNTGSTTAVVDWIDRITPIVSIRGTPTLSIEEGSIFIDSGATWSDDRDGTGSISIATLGSVNTSMPGVYSLTYVYTDQAGNRGIAVRSVVVQTKYSSTVLVGPGGGGGSSVTPLNIFKNWDTLLHTPTVSATGIVVTTSNYIPLSELIKNNIIPTIRQGQKQTRMTRGEFIKILSLMNGYEGGEIKNKNTPFRDIKNSQYSTYIEYAIGKNWVSQKNTRFRPNDTITIGEANKLINVFLEMTDGESSAIGNMLLTRDNAYSLLMSIE